MKCRECLQMRKQPKLIGGSLRIPFSFKGPKLARSSNPCHVGQKHGSLQPTRNEQTNTLRYFKIQDLPPGGNKKNVRTAKNRKANHLKAMRHFASQSSCPTSRRYGPARPPMPAVPVPPLPPSQGPAGEPNGRGEKPGQGPVLLPL